MRLRVLIFFSVALNLILFGVWFFGLRYSPATAVTPVVPDIDAPSNKVRVQTNLVVRRQNFTWQEVESDNYLTYIKNLRDIGCPGRTIRDIIVADVDALFAHRRATEIISADHQWWRSEPDIEAVQKAADKLKSLETERRALLTRLLGASWETTANPLPPLTRTGISLTGPVLGDLAPETKQAVYDIAARTQQKLEEYQDEQGKAGQQIDAMEMAKLRQQSRLELARILSPEQMEEFLLRYSQTALQMRSDLRGLELSPEAFRNFFRARDPLEQQPELYYAGNDPTLLKRQQDLEAQRDAAIQQALGKEQYATYKLHQDPVFREAQAAADEAGAPAALVMPIYQINQLSEAERQRIRGDATLTADEKVDALASVQAEREKSLQKILAPEVLQQYRSATNGVPPLP